jgi:multicomponent Na+:H+ antiporter subunit G
MILAVGWTITALGTLVLVIAAVGVLRLPDSLSRQHAATKAGTLAVSLFALGLVLVAWANGWGWGWAGRLLLMVLVLLTTLPIASHALARAGVAERQSRAEQAHSGDVPSGPCG